MRAPYFFEHPYNQLGEDMARIPLVMIDDKRRQTMTARVSLPRNGQPPFVIEACVHYGAAMPQQGVGALFDGKIAKGVKKMAKKVAKNKAFQVIAKTAPLWANVIPPPAGQVIAAGSLAAQAAMKLKDAAKKGSPAAKKFLADAKQEKAKVAATAKTALKVSATLKKAGAPAATRAKAVNKVLNKGGFYQVTRPDGSVVKVPAAQVRA